MNRRALLIAASLAALLAACGQHPAPPETPATDATADAPRPLRRIRFLLNSGFSGANAWFLLADERGYFRREGIEVEFTPGRGAFTAAGRMVGEGFDVGYGDIQAVYEQAATVPGKSPVGVYMMMDRSPSVIILPAQSPIRSAEQLKGRTITGHATDVALNTIAQYAHVAAVDAASVQIGTNEGNWNELLALLDSGESDALFGYLSTSSAAVRTAGQGQRRHQGQQTPGQFRKRWDLHDRFLFLWCGLIHARHAQQRAWAARRHPRHGRGRVHVQGPLPPSRAHAA